MTSAIPEPAIRNATPAYTDEITDLAAAAAWDTPVARWLNADPIVRRREPRLERAGIPTYLKANNHRNRDLYRRPGYVCQTTELRPDGSPVWTMWRSPMP
jgi:hypothetical protein